MPIASSSSRSGQNSCQKGTVPFINDITLDRGVYETRLFTTNVILNVPNTLTIAFTGYTSLVLTQGVYYGGALAKLLNDHCALETIPLSCAFSSSTNRFTFSSTADVHLSTDDDVVTQRLFGQTHLYILNGVPFETNQLNFSRTRHYKLILSQVNENVYFSPVAAFQETFQATSLNTFRVTDPLVQLQYEFVGDDGLPIEMGEWDLYFNQLL